MWGFILITTFNFVILQTIGHPTRTDANLDTPFRLGIFDGNGTSIESHPYIVSVYSNSKLFCAGSIVSKRWILTTGYCVNNFQPKDIQIVAGSQDGVTGTSYGVKKVVLHPKCSGYDYQFACVQIDGHFDWSYYVKAIKLPDKEPKANTKMVVAGWGSRVNEGSSNYVLQEGAMQWLSKAVCKTSLTGFVDPDQWTNRMACAYNKGQTTLCEGDWGDPFVKNGVLFGHFVAGDERGFCSSDAKPVLLADIHTVVPWIRKVTGA